MKQKKFIKLYQSKSKTDLLNGLRDIAKTKTFRVVILSLKNETQFTKKDSLNEEILEYIKNSQTPIITIVKNSAKDFVFEIVLASHLCIASNSAKFVIEDIEKLKAQVGTKNLKKLSFIENNISAEKALDLGFINKVVPEKNLEKEAFEIAGKIADLAPLAISSCLKAVNEGLAMDLENGLKLETKLFASIFATEDMKEGTSAFLEKRQPVFRGK